MRIMFMLGSSGLRGQKREDLRSRYQRRGTNVSSQATTHRETQRHSKAVDHQQVFCRPHVYVSGGAERKRAFCDD